MVAVMVDNPAPARRPAMNRLRRACGLNRAQCSRPLGFGERLGKGEIQKVPAQKGRGWHIATTSPARELGT